MDLQRNHIIGELLYLAYFFMNSKVDEKRMLFVKKYISILMGDNGKGLSFFMSLSLYPSPYLQSLYFVLIFHAAFDHVSCVFATS